MLQLVDLLTGVFIDHPRISDKLTNSCIAPSGKSRKRSRPLVHDSQQRQLQETPANKPTKKRNLVTNYTVRENPKPSRARAALIFGRAPSKKFFPLSEKLSETKRPSTATRKPSPSPERISTPQQPLESLFPVHEGSRSPLSQRQEDEANQIQYDEIESPSESEKVGDVWDQKRYRDEHRRRREEQRQSKDKEIALVTPAQKVTPAQRAREEKRHGPAALKFKNAQIILPDDERLLTNAEMKKLMLSERAKSVQVSTTLETANVKIEGLEKKLHSTQQDIKKLEKQLKKWKEFASQNF